jgi:hypothetical protein
MSNFILSYSGDLLGWIVDLGNVEGSPWTKPMNQVKNLGVMSDTRNIYNI